MTWKVQILLIALAIYKDCWYQHEDHCRCGDCRQSWVPFAMDEFGLEPQ